MHGKTLLYAALTLAGGARAEVYTWNGQAVTIDNSILTQNNSNYYGQNQLGSYHWTHYPGGSFSPGWNWGQGSGTIYCCGGEYGAECADFQINHCGWSCGCALGWTSATGDGYNSFPQLCDGTDNWDGTAPTLNCMYGTNNQYRSYIKTPENPWSQVYFQCYSATQCLPPPPSPPAPPLPPPSPRPPPPPAETRWPPSVPDATGAVGGMGHGNGKYGASASADVSAPPGCGFYGCGFATLRDVAYDAQTGAYAPGARGAAGVPGVGAGEWFALTLPTAIVLSSYQMQLVGAPAPAASGPGAWVVAGSNDGQAWSVLDVRNARGSWTPADAAAPRLFHAYAQQAYRSYLFVVTAGDLGGDGRWSLRNVAFYSGGTAPPPPQPPPPPPDEFMGIDGDFTASAPRCGGVTTGGWELSNAI